jgi:hypothetical protein
LFFEKKSGAPERFGALLFMGGFLKGALLRGVLGKAGVSLWFFHGEVVVIVW